MQQNPAIEGQQGSIVVLVLLTNVNITGAASGEYDLEASGIEIDFHVVC